MQYSPQSKAKRLKILTELGVDMKNRWIMKLIETTNRTELEMPWAAGSDQSEWAANCRKRAMSEDHIDA